MTIMAFCLYLNRRSLAVFMVGGGGDASAGNDVVVDLVCSLALTAALFQVNSSCKISTRAQGFPGLCPRCQKQQQQKSLYVLQDAVSALHTLGGGLRCVVLGV
jgi:hypothetical protein